MAQDVRFFEDEGGPAASRRLLIAIKTWEDGPWEVDGGRREAVRLATTEDATTYAAAYAEYMQQFEPEGPAEGFEAERFEAERQAAEPSV